MAMSYLRPKTRRWMTFTTLLLIFVAVNLFTMVYWHSNLPLESNWKTSIRQSNKPRQTTSSNTLPQPSTTTPLPHPRTERQDRMVTLDRLKHVLEINNTVELLRTINTRGDGIPLWSNIEQLYGPEIPHVLGIEHCPMYRRTIPESQRWVAPAGLFHTGTNLLTSLMTSSCHGVSFQGQVPYGKHNPIFAAKQADYRIPSKLSYEMVQNFSQILPIVMVRHPLDWMKSMCHQKFAVSWKNTTSTTTPVEKLPCPSLDTPISVHFFQRMEYNHLMDLWRQWNQEYLDYDSDQPRLMVRLEDLVYAPKETLQMLCDCVGGNLRYRPQSMAQRKGGVKQEAGNNFVIQTWARHSHATIHHTLASSPENHKLFQRVVATSQVQRLLAAFQYAIR